MAAYQDEQCLFATFNQDLGCFAIGTKNGFQVFQTQPLKKIVDRPFEGGIQLIEMLYHSNLFALVGTGKNFQFPQSKVIIWDDNEKKQISELLFKSKVFGIKMRPNKLIVILEEKIFQYSFPSFKLETYVETCINQRAVFSVNQSSEQFVMAVPLEQQGTVKVFIEEEKKYSNVIKAHQSQLGAIELNYTGNKLATASEKGNVVRIFNTFSGFVIQELRRGDEYATIYSINFEPKGRFIAVSSDSSKVHIFKVNLFDDEINKLKENDEQVLQIHNPNSILSFLSYFNLPYFAMNRSFSFTQIPEIKKIVSFGIELNQLNIVTYDGKFYNTEFDLQKGGEFKPKLCSQNYLNI